MSQPTTVKIADLIAKSMWCDSGVCKIPNKELHLSDAKLKFGKVITDSAARIYSNDTALVIDGEIGTDNIRRVELYNDLAVSRNITASGDISAGSGNWLNAGGIKINGGKIQASGDILKIGNWQIWEGTDGNLVFNKTGKPMSLTLKYLDKSDIAMQLGAWEINSTSDTNLGFKRTDNNNRYYLQSGLTGSDKRISYFI